MRNNRVIAAAIAFGAIVMVGAWTGVNLAADKKSGGSLFDKIIEGVKTAGELLPIGYEEEQSIGEAIALQLVARSGGLVEQPELTRYVNLVGRAVAATSDRPDIPYRFAVLNDASINAFAAPAGYVFVTNGLLKQIQNEAELAGVLGHEIAHISEKHILEVIQRGKWAKAGQKAAGLTKNPQMFKDAIDVTVKDVFENGLDQNKEIEADSLGDAFAARVGYDPTAYPALLIRLRALKGDDRALLKTHPSYSTRIDALQKTIQSQGLKANGVLLADRFARRSS